MTQLINAVAVVAGATRGAGCGIAVELDAAGATVYVTGRTTRTHRSEYGRPETIEETAELVRAAAESVLPPRWITWRLSRSLRLPIESAESTAGSIFSSTTSGAAGTWSSGRPGSGKQDADRTVSRMPHPHAQIQTALECRKSYAEKEKIDRRLPPDSGLDAIGVRMKTVFDTAKEWTELDLALVPGLLSSQWYETRMVGVSILDFKARQRGLVDDERRRLYATYLNNHEFINVWDLVDRAAPRVIGWYLLDKSRRPLFDLARSEKAIERRTAITAAFWLIRQGDLDDPIKLAELLLDDPAELVAKPVGTALREVGKMNQSRLLDVLAAHRDRMRRPTLRLATNLLPDDIKLSLEV